MFAARVASSLVERFKETVALKIQSGDTTRDQALSKTLEGLRLASVHAADAILEQLLEWRVEALDASASGRVSARSSHGAVLRSRLVIEAFFMDAAKCVVQSSSTTSSTIQKHVREELEELAFNWILNADRYVGDYGVGVGHVGLAGHVHVHVHGHGHGHGHVHGHGHGHAAGGDSIALKDKVVLSASQLLGELSYASYESLGSIQGRFLEEFGQRIAEKDASSPARQEAYDLCHAMRFVKLRGDTVENLRASIRFLDAVFPLRHVAPEKKSRPQQALCDLLTTILSPLADIGGEAGEESRDSAAIVSPQTFGAMCGDQALQREWFSKLRFVRTELTRWVAKQSKQGMAAYPAITVLTCVEDESVLMTTIDGLIETLNRQVREKNRATCSMGLLCLARAISCFLRRVGPRSDQERLASWVGRATGNAVGLAVRGSFVAPEQVIVMKHMCVAVAATMPAYAIQGMLLEMMALNQGHCWEAPYIAVSSLVPILATAPSRLFREGDVSFSDDPASSMSLSQLPPTPAALEALVMSLGSAHQFGKPVSRVVLQRMERLMQQDYSLMDILGIRNLEEELCNSLEKVRSQCHQLHGYSRVSSSQRYQGDWIKEKISALTVLVSVLECLPFIIPSGWKVAASGDGDGGGSGASTKASKVFMDDVTGYTMHAEPCVRNAAAEALVRCMSAWPGSRDCIMQGMAHVMKSVMQGEDVAYVKESAALFLKLMGIWESSLGQSSLSLAIESRLLWASSSSEPMSFDSIHSVESCGFFMLCHEDVQVRDLGLKVLESACQLFITLREFAQGVNHMDHPGMDSSTSRVPSSLGSKSASDRDRDRDVDFTSLEQAIAPTPGTGIAATVKRGTLHQSTSLAPRMGVKSGNPDDQYRRSFSEMMSPRANNFPGTLPWQRTISATVRAEPRDASSVPTSPTAGGDAEHRCLIEIIYAYGDQIARRNFWNYGIYSKIIRTWKPLPEQCSFRSCLYGGADSVPFRSRVWLRIMADLMKHCWIHAKDTALRIVAEAFEGLGNSLIYDQQGRKYMVLEGAKGAWSNAYAFAIAPTPSRAASHSEDFTKKFGLFASILINTVWAGSEEALGALEFVDESFQGMVVEKAQTLQAEYKQQQQQPPERRFGILEAATKPAGGTKKDGRLAHAQILAAVCANLAPSSLSGQVAMRDTLISFLIDAMRVLDVLGDISSDIQQLRYCLCIISRELSLQLSVSQSQVFPPMLRKQLYGKFATYTEEGQTQGLFRSELRRQIAAAKANVKPRDPARIQEVEREIVVSSEMLEHAANLAMGAMLMGPVFDSDTKKPEGKVLTWIRRMLGADAASAERHHAEWAPKRGDIAKEALEFLLLSNLDMAKLFVDQCYSVQQPVSDGYFLVLADVVMQTSASKLEPQTLIALVLSKMVDPDAQVRSKASKLLHTIERRYNPGDGWGGSGGSGGLEIAMGKLGLDRGADGAKADGLDGLESDLLVQDLVVVGGLQNSNTIFQQKVSSAMAVHYDGIALPVVLEVLRRQVQSSSLPDRVHLTLPCLPPWLENADFRRDSWLHPALELLFQVSNIDGLIQTSVVQDIWGTIASQRGNVAPVLDYLVQRLVRESRGDASSKRPGHVPYSATMESGKHIALYLSRVAPKITIQHLITLAEFEVTQRNDLNDEGPLDVVPANNSVELGLIKEWHHRAAQALAQQPLPQQQPLAARAAAAIAAETADESQPFTASSFAQAIKRSTVDILLKTGVAVVDTVAVAGAAAVGAISSSGLVDILDEDSKLSRWNRAKYGEFDNDDAGPAGDRVGNLLRHSSLAQATSPNSNSNSNLSPSGVSSPTNEGYEHVVPVPMISKHRMALSSQEGALCLLSEIVSENDEYIRPHLARLLHIAVLQLDSCNRQACHEACQLLQFLLYNLSYKILETNSKDGSSNKAVYTSDYARVAGVIGFLQSLPEGERAWDWELPTLTHPWISSAGSVAAFVQIAADCFPFDKSLAPKWSAEALKWACCSSTRHGASRSHQIYCSLSPSLTSPACTALVFCLEKCLRTASSDGLDMAVEILCTIRVLLSNTDREKVILYPHLFAACIALLNSTVVRVGELAIAMLIDILDCLDFADAAVQQAILTVFCPDELCRRLPKADASFIHVDDEHEHEPYAVSDDQKWILGQSLLLGGDTDEAIEQVTGPWMVLQQLLVKGLFQGDTESLTLQAFAFICRQISREASKSVLPYGGHVGNGIGGHWRGGRAVDESSRSKTARFTKTVASPPSYPFSTPRNSPFCIESILGDASIGLAITIASALPWIFVQVNLKSELSDVISAFLVDVSEACRCVGWHDVSALLLCLESDPNSKISDIDMSLRNWSREVMPIIINELFPDYSLLFIQRIVETVQRAPSVYQRAALYILEAIFASSSSYDLNIGNDEQILHETNLVDMLALELNGNLGGVVVRVMRALSRHQKVNLNGNNEGDDAEATYLSWRNSMDEIGECNKVCASALARVAFLCPRSGELVGGESEHSHLMPFLNNDHV